MTSQIPVPLVTLNNGLQMPQMGMGLGNGLAEHDMIRCVDAALEMGYRSFDTAPRYRNERGLGVSLERSGLPREQLFVTTKVWTTDLGRDATLRALVTSLEQLRLEYVDLYLIHFPAPMLGPRFVETWLALEELYRDGCVRAVGVANFKAHHLAMILEAGMVVPAINQIELHPRYQQTALRRLHADFDIKSEAWSPLARGLVLSDPVIGRLAEQRGTSTAQLVLRWHIQVGNIVIPKSVTPARMRQNLEAVTLPPLDDDEMAVIDSLDCGARTGPDPDEFLDGRPEWNEAVARYSAALESSPHDSPETRRDA